MLKYLLGCLILVPAACTTYLNSYQDYSYARAAVSMVILEEEYVAHGYGSAVAISSQRIYGSYKYVNYYLTAAHVVEKAVNNPTVFHISVRGVGNVDKATLLIINPKFDAALIRTESDLPATNLRLSRGRIFPDQPIVSIGYPMGFAQSITEGIVNSYVANHIDGCWMCSAPTGPGGSGGAVIDRSTGSLIGITTNILQEQGDNGYLVTLTHVNIFLSVNSIYDWIMGEVTNVR